MLKSCQICSRDAQKTLGAHRLTPVRKLEATSSSPRAPHPAEDITRSLFVSRTAELPRVLPIYIAEDVGGNHDGKHADKPGIVFLIERDKKSFIRVVRPEHSHRNQEAKQQHDAAP